MVLDWLKRVGASAGGAAEYPPSEELETRLQHELESSLAQISGELGARMAASTEADTMVLNIGPQHPSTHGVLRLITELNGETIVRLQQDLGFVHTGIEKNFEHKTYTKGTVFTDRMGYVSPISNNLAYVLAVEKLCQLEAPPRARTVRLILHELDRIASHLVWLGTTGLELGALSVFLYCFREREKIMDMVESISGMRMMASYLRPGGLAWDLPGSFEGLVRHFLDTFPASLRGYEGILSGNPIWLERTRGVGVISAELALAYGLTGPPLRASGVDWDLRRRQPYLDYPEYEFEVPVAHQGDCYARYRVRMEEMAQSLRLVEQGLARLEPGPVMAHDRKYVPPPREELAVSMEAVIHHFKYWTEGFLPPRGEVYQAIEAPRGEMGFYIVSDGSARPWRVHMRAPSFYNLQCLRDVAPGHLIADLIAIVATLDPVMGEVDR